jgi:hypothetical protein
MISDISLHILPSVFNYYSYIYDTMLPGMYLFTLNWYSADIYLSILMYPVWPDIIGPEYFDPKRRKHICNKSIPINVSYHFSSLGSDWNILPQKFLSILTPFWNIWLQLTSAHWKFDFLQDLMLAISECFRLDIWIHLYFLISSRWSKLVVGATVSLGK